MAQQNAYACVPHPAWMLHPGDSASAGASATSPQAPRRTATGHATSASRVRAHGEGAESLAGRAQRFLALGEVEANEMLHRFAEEA